MLLAASSAAIAQKPTVPPTTRVPPVARPGVPRAVDSARITLPPGALSRLAVGTPFANGDFESGLDGWTVAGDAFEGQPVRGDNVTHERFGLVSLGGDYWRGAPVDIGRSGQGWIGTYERGATASKGSGATQGDGPTGTLTSGYWPLDEAHRFLSLMVGGGYQDVGVELQIRGTTPAESDAIAAEAARSADASVSAIPRDGPWVTYLTVGGQNRERMRQVVYEIPASLRGRGYQGRVRIVDNSSGGWGHINVDDVRVTAERPQPRNPGLWGYADLHTHPMMHQGFGGLRGIRTLWGVPGGAFADYGRDPSLIARDLPSCDGAGHYGGPISQILVNGLEGRLPQVTGFGIVGMILHPGYLTATLQRALFHERGLAASPVYSAGAHQQMHITQMRRSYDGGLRLMSALAITSEILEYSMSPVVGGEARAQKRVEVTANLDVLRAHVCGMRQLAAMNRDWMEIAYSPDDARRIIGENKLAVILGSELPQLGSLGLATPEAEVEFLHSLGIRQVTPVHAANNRIGGAAIFQDVYNTANDYLNRPPAQRNVDGEQFRAGNHPPLSFFQVREGGCGQGPLAGLRGECVLYRLKEDPEALTYDMNVLLGFHPSAEGVQTVHDYVYPPRNGYAGPQGHLNQASLTEYGSRYLRALMGRGMLIDIAHMSDRTATAAMQLARMGTPARNRACGDFSSLQAMASAPAECFEGSYPLMVSHVAWRAQSVHGDGTFEGATAGTTVRDFLPREMELSEHTGRIVARSGGIIGVFLGQDPIENPPGWSGPGVANDCATTSKSFAHALAYSIDRMGGRGVAVATDFGFHPMAMPRFGPAACAAYLAAGDQARERERMPGQYRTGAQRDGVRYASAVPATGVTVGTNAPLRPYTLGSRSFTINLDGLAHYGMIPDMLQDTRNVGMTAEQMAPLFRSAEDYVQTWEKAHRVGQVALARFTPAALECRAICRGTCPQDPRAGAPVAAR